MKPLRILHTESSTDLGGQEFRVLAEAIGMRRRGHTVVLALDAQSRLRERAVQKGVPVHSVSLKRHRYPALVLDFLRLIAHHSIELVNTHGSLDSWTASLAARLSKRRPVVLRTRHKSIPISRTLRHQVLYKRLPDAIITTGEAVREHLVRGQGIDEARVVSIPTGVDLERYCPGPDHLGVREELGVAPGEVVLGTVAFLRDYKGLDTLLEATQLLLRTHGDVRVVIVGSGPEQGALQQSIGRMGLSERVVLTGFREDVPRLLAAMDVFVLPSVEAEGLPQGLTQAMAMRRPVVATAVGSISEVVQDGETGLLVAPRDPRALAESVTRLIESPALRERVSEAGRILVERSYSLEAMLNRTEQLYECLLNVHKRGGRSVVCSRRAGNEALAGSDR